jgi:ribosomal-protein-alanine N-acetyltransferase
MLIRTARLCLRPWRDEDIEPFAALNGDARVMEFYPALLTRAETEARLEKVRAHFAEHGFGMWVVEENGGASFAGVVGLTVPDFVAPFTPCVDVGWRLAAAYWGRGYATEAARAALEFGFGALGLREIVAMTTVANVRSRRVMEKLGMRHDPADDFLHPSIPEGHPIRPHVLYRLGRGDGG